MTFRRRSRRLTCSALLAVLASAICLVIKPLVGADFPGCRNGNCPNCPVNARYFGYYPTIWRRWPGTEPQPQPAPQPAPEQNQVPAVEPPPAAEEIEKSKTMSDSAGGAGSGAPDSAKAGTTPPADDSGPKTPPMPPADRGTLLPPSDAPKLDRLRDAPEKLPGLDGRPPSDTTPTSPSARAWPPVNMLRNDEVRASYQLPERSAPVTLAPSSAQLQPAFAPPAGTPRQPKSPAKPGNSAAEQLHASRQSAGGDNHALCPSEPIVQPAKALPLHWLEPASSEPAGKDRPSPAAASRDSDPRGSDSAQWPGPGVASGALAIQSGGTTNATLSRLPLMPRQFSQNSLASALERPMPGRTEPQGVVPTDALGTAIAPPEKVNQITVPMIPHGAIQASQQSARDATLDNVTRIDPLAIGRSLSPGELPGSSGTAPLLSANPIASTTRPAKPSAGSAMRFDGTLPATGMPRPSSIPAPTVGKSTPAVVVATGPATIPAAWPPAGAKAALVVSDGDADDTVIPTAYWASEPLHRSSFAGESTQSERTPGGVSKSIDAQAQTSRANPLRSPSSEPSSGPPTIWKNPLR